MRCGIENYVTREIYIQMQGWTVQNHYAFQLLQSRGHKHIKLLIFFNLKIFEWKNCQSVVVLENELSCLFFLQIFLHTLCRNEIWFSVIIIINLLIQRRFSDTMCVFQSSFILIKREELYPVITKVRMGYNCYSYRT